MRLLLDRAGYPSRLHVLTDPPRQVTTTGPLDPDARVVAIVGARDATPRSEAFAFDLARALASAGVVIASGGAVGVDAAAHRGALAACGRTWAVLPNGRHHCTPPENRRLFQAISLSPGSRLVWPFADDVTPKKDGQRFHYRNAVLVALADDVIVVQAHLASGSLNAARWARSFGRRTWATPAPPWSTGFAGSNLLLARGDARPIWSGQALVETLLGRPLVTPIPWTGGLGRDADIELPGKNDIPLQLTHRRHATKRPAGRPRRKGPRQPSLRVWTPEESAVLSALSDRPSHLDAIAQKSGLAVSSTVTALLTLALEDVVVEGPDGFFRLQIAG